MPRLKVLMLSRSYPNNVLKLLGLWVERLVSHVAEMCDLRVIAPVPYCPPLPGLSEYARFRQVALQRQEGGIAVDHPRFLVGLGYSLYNAEALAYYLGIRRVVERIRHDFPFDVIHAHFSYPDGVVGVWLGQQYGVPVVVTEHAPWQGWMDRYGFVRRQAVWAARKVAFHIAVSSYVRATIAYFTGNADRIRVIPIGVDGSVFSPSVHGDGVYQNQVLYVGFINYNKGIDVLLKAMQLLLKQRPEIRLVIVGGGFYRKTRLQEERLRKMADDLGLSSRVTFVGPKPPEEVTHYMRKSALLVLPSRAESFGAVLVEALACGTPVVATRCGGPEDIVSDEVGTLVPPEDENALAEGIGRILQRRGMYNPERLRTYALERFSWERVANDTVNVYQQALQFGSPQ